MSLSFQQRSFLQLRYQLGRLIGESETVRKIVSVPIDFPCHRLSSHRQPQGAASCELRTGFHPTRTLTPNHDEETKYEPHHCRQPLVQGSQVGWVVDYEET
jgi:hypothetical protein